VTGVTEQVRDLRAYLAARASQTTSARSSTGCSRVPSPSRPCRPLADFRERVAAKQGKTIAADVAQHLLADATRIAAVAACGT
jgi:hypothetical protein